MAETMVDSNVLLDVLTEDPAWFEWSSRSLEECAEHHILVINPIIYAEVSIGFDRIEDLDAALPESMVERRPIPLEAAFLAGKCFLRYRERGGRRQSTLPDFFIGAHAAVQRMRLLTRDASRYRTYFPKLKLICPE
jgi:predicted nucleic acid-binding protein